MTTSFRECSACAEPGCPDLCASCVHNRDAITRLHHDRNEIAMMANRISDELTAAKHANRELSDEVAILRRALAAAAESARAAPEPASPGPWKLIRSSAPFAGATVEYHQHAGVYRVTTHVADVAASVDLACQRVCMAMARVIKDVTPGAKPAEFFTPEGIFG